MHILGLSCGSSNGNSEILLKAALKSAASADPSITISIIRIPDVAIPFTYLPSPLGNNPRPAQPTGQDNRKFALDAILESDAIILASPTYTKDAAGVRRMIEKKERDDEQFKLSLADKCMLKPRVGALIAVGGAKSPEWLTLLLPGLVNSLFSLHVKIVAMQEVIDVGFPSAVLAEEGSVKRSQKLGENVASQIGKEYDVAEWLGDREGSCKFCHLDIVRLSANGDNKLECAACGAMAVFEIDGSGVVNAVMLDEPKTSVVTMTGKERHMDEIETSTGDLSRIIAYAKEQIRQY